MLPGLCHVNRFPLAADVRNVQHIPGKHGPAFNKDSDRNKRVIMRLKTDLGDIKVVQIAGAVARRIVPYADGGDHVHKSDKLGLIRIGSRFDVITPVGRVLDGADGAAGAGGDVADRQGGRRRLRGDVDLDKQIEPGLCLRKQ